MHRDAVGVVASYIKDIAFAYLDFLVAGWDKDHALDLKGVQSVDVTVKSLSSCSSQSAWTIRAIFNHIDILVRVVKASVLGKLDIRNP